MGASERVLVFAYGRMLPMAYAPFLAVCFAFLASMGTALDSDFVKLMPAACRGLESQRAGITIRRELLLLGPGK